MEGTNQPATRPPAPTVEDEFPTENQANTASTAQRNMSGLPNGPSASADDADTHDTEPGTPTNNGHAANADQPRTPANAAPDAPPADRVQIVLKDQSGMQVAFGVKSNTRMEKVQNAYADRAGRPVGTLRFYYEGARVLPEDTVASLEMENEDIIEVMTEQIGGGGGGLKDTPPEQVSIMVEECTINGKYCEAIHFKMSSCSEFSKLMRAWTQRFGVTDLVLGLGDNFTLKVMQDPEKAVPTNAADHWTEMEGINVETETPAKSFVLIVKYLNQADVSREMHCKMTPDMSFNKLIDLYAKCRDIDASAQRLTFQGITVFPSDTPASIGAEHGAVLNIAEDPNVFALDLTLE
ncbi:hypothetical protein E4T48_03148 [Aureobasidium sp. EXF-10727]|nr:hypothetical protein E4T48_03148 [Aureobasidium sp. EXF-10727]KAI4727691.1 hypothetical protein E4T49_04585 [Aureobasidium sp. EXF-10728]